MLLTILFTFSVIAANVYCIDKIRNFKLPNKERSKDEKTDS